MTNREGVPDITPFDELRDSPIGRDPEVMKNDRLSPLVEGEVENGSIFDRTYED